MQELNGMRLLVVDDNAANVELIEQVLRQAGYTELVGTRAPESVAPLCESWKPDLILLDLHMPGLSGFQVMQAIEELMAEPESLPVLVLTADGTTAARHRALSMGARDFLTKPIDHEELLLRVRNLLHTRHLQQRLQERNAELDEAVRLRTVELEEARLESLALLATMAEYHDVDTHDHTARVGRVAQLISAELGLPALFVSQIRDAAPLHDVGKVGISDAILRKPGPLTDDERRRMQQHVEIGRRILEPACSPTLRLAAEIAQSHHERWDGRGYLLGLSGAQIPLGGRITAVADVFDALTHNRPYKRAWDIDTAVAEIAAQAGAQFDPKVVDAFLTLDHAALVHQPSDGARVALATAR